MDAQGSRGLTLQETQPPLETQPLMKLGIAATVSGAYRAVFGRFWPLCKAAALPFVLSIVIGAAGVVVADTHFTLDLAVQLLSLLPLVIFGIAWGRIVLLGPRSGAIPRPLLGMRTWIYFGYLLVYLLLFIIPFLLLFAGSIGLTYLAGTTAAGPDPMALLAQALWVVPTGFLLYLLLLYVSLRLALVFPAVSVDQRLSLAGSWRLTRGNGLRFFAAMILTMLPVVFAVMLFGSFFSNLLVSSIDLGQPGGGLIGPDGSLSLTAMALFFGPTMVFSIIVQYIAFGLVAAAVAKVYAQFSGWSETGEDMLKRFE